MIRRPPRSTLFPTRRSSDLAVRNAGPLKGIGREAGAPIREHVRDLEGQSPERLFQESQGALHGLVVLDRKARVADRKRTRLNSSHANISYAVFCLKTTILIH